MKRSSIVALTAVLALASCPVSRAAEEASPSLVVVVPGRYAFVKLAQDLAALRPVTVVSYSTTNNNAIFLWDRDAAKWSPLDTEDFASGKGFYTSSHLIAMGTDEATVKLFASSARAWAVKVESFPKLDIAKTLNAASDVLHFSEGEWKWLSERYGLSLKDGNAERRKYGKYGPPGQKRTPPAKAPPAPVEDVVLPEPVPPSPALAAPKVSEPVVPPAPAPAPAPAAKGEAVQAAPPAAQTTPAAAAEPKATPATEEPKVYPAPAAQKADQGQVIILRP
jgi:hypothetical protein